MSSGVIGKSGITVPQLLVHEGEGLTLTIEVRNGTVYRGRASHTEDNFNMHLDGVSITEPDGTQRSLERVFIRGSTILFVIYPDILARAPVFERVRAAAKGKVLAGGLGKKRLEAMQARSEWGAPLPAR